MVPKGPQLESILESLPSQPGIYLMKDGKNKIIYIGAASNLKKRVTSYFRKNIPDQKTQRLVSKIELLDYEIHGSEEEAFLRERELIRIHTPRFNLDWRDDKEYPMIQITAPSPEEEFSRIFIVRSISNRNNWYFGRKTDVTALRTSVRSLRKIFPIANKTYCFKTKKPCLDYSIQRCCAPCASRISKKKYQEMVSQLILFLQGKRKDLIETLYQEMDIASDNLDFEHAAKIRDRIKQIESTIDTQKGFPQARDKDVIILIEDSNHFSLIISWIKNNVIVNSETIYLGFLEVLSVSEILKSFIHDYYLSTNFIPNTILILNKMLNELEILGIWLSKKKGQTVELKINPQIANDPEFKLTISRFQLQLSEKVRSFQNKEQLKNQALSELQEFLGLMKVPRRIEAYDISNIQGAFPVGSMVVFINGSPLKKGYRRFKIKFVKSDPNDVAMMQEILTRRLEHNDPKFASSLPELIVIDGGKPQVNAIFNVLRRKNMNIPVIGLAKREEQVFLPNISKPVAIPQDGVALQLLKQCRDEAHRFAISYHKRRRLLKPRSQLDQITGVGSKRRNALLLFFGDLNGIKDATVDEICEVEGINREVAERIFLFFKTKK